MCSPLVLFYGTETKFKKLVKDSYCRTLTICFFVWIYFGFREGRKVWSSNLFERIVKNSGTTEYTEGKIGKRYMNMKNKYMSKFLLVLM